MGHYIHYKSLRIEYIFPMAANLNCGTKNLLKNILLTGKPGIGKTTLIVKLKNYFIEEGYDVSGFYTEELRNQGSRIGFDIKTLDGDIGPLARLIDTNKSDSNHYPKDGRYSVDIKSFERLALKSLKLKNTKCIYIIDEIGKMELFSNMFQNSVHSLFSSKTAIILATIPQPSNRPIPFVNKITQCDDTKVYEITYNNRNTIFEE